MQYQKVRIVKDPVATVISRSVPAWEIDVLKAVYGRGNVQASGEFEFVDRPYPTADVEYQRLETAYGNDRESGGAPFVAQVYGTDDRGIAKLGDAIEAEMAAEQERLDAGIATRRVNAPVPDIVVKRDPLLA